MQHGVCRIELCCLVYFAAIVKNQSFKKKNRVYDSICCMILLLRTASFFEVQSGQIPSLFWHTVKKSAPQGRAIKKKKKKHPRVNQYSTPEEKVKGTRAKVVRSLIKCARQTCRRKLSNAHVITHLRTIHPNIRIINSPIYEPVCVHPSEWVCRFST